MFQTQQEWFTLSLKVYNWCPLQLRLQPKTVLSLHAAHLWYKSLWCGHVNSAVMKLLLLVGVKTASESCREFVLVPVCTVSSALNTTEFKKHMSGYCLESPMYYVLLMIMYVNFQPKLPAMSSHVSAKQWSMNYKPLSGVSRKAADDIKLMSTMLSSKLQGVAKYAEGSCWVWAQHLPLILKTKWPMYT